MSDPVRQPDAEPSAHAEAGAPAWMATFADMMTLLLCFFVLLLSFATVDIVKFRDMLGSLDEAFGVTRVDPGPYHARASTPVELSSAGQPAPLRAEAAARVSGVEREVLEHLGALAERPELRGLVESDSGPDGVVLRLNGAFLFESGSDAIRLGAMALLDEIAALAAPGNLRISVEGHTDDLPIRSERFPTNWHLSTARAIAGVLYLTGPGKLPPERVSATGHAHTRPLAWGESEAARAENRRLEIVFRPAPRAGQ